MFQFVARFKGRTLCFLPLSHCTFKIQMFDTFTPHDSLLSLFKAPKSDGYVHACIESNQLMH